MKFVTNRLGSLMLQYLFFWRGSLVSSMLITGTVGQRLGTEFEWELGKGCVILL